MRLFALVRSAIYMAGFVVLWAWLGLSLRRFDSLFGLPIPESARLAGMGLMAVGAAIGLWCGIVFSLRGRGTPALFDPPREFVPSGPYCYVRNPMYEGGALLLLGFGLYLRSAAVLLLALLFILVVHVFVVLVEEPGLERRFGETYLQYKRSVNRWWPIFRTGISKKND
jgi:protein-S-isoprenylcysteine O-methyltransferase Ste14